MGNQFDVNPKYWAEEVKKFLYARMDSVWTDSSGNKEEILNFLGSLTISPYDLEWLSRLYHILRSEGAWEYITQELPGAVNTLTRNRETSVITDKRGPRGKILWGPTRRGQILRSDVSYYVSVRPSRTPNTPENMVLKQYIKELSKFRLPKDPKELKSKSGQKMAELYYNVHELLSSVYLKDIPLPSEVTPRMLARVDREKRRIYSRLGELWREFERCVQARELETIKEMLASGWLAPKLEDKTDDLFELFVLINVIKVLEGLVLHGSDTKNVKYGLIRPDGAIAVVIIEGKEWNAEVCFDRAPEKLFGIPPREGLYQRIISYYEGISGSARRPDVSIRLKEVDSDTEIRLLVEAKNAPSDSDYASESIYKVFGYLKDYKMFWKDDQLPKIILAFPGGTTPISEDKLFCEDVAIISGDLESWLKKIFLHFMNI